MMERIAHYRELAAQFRQWAENETCPKPATVCLIWPGNTSGWPWSYKRAPRRRKTRQGQTAPILAGNPMTNSCLGPAVHLIGRRSAKGCSMVWRGSEAANRRPRRIRCAGSI